MNRNQDGVGTQQPAAAEEYEPTSVQEPMPVQESVPIQQPSPVQQPAPDWMDAFDQLFYGNDTQGGGQEQQEEWNEEQEMQTWIEPEPSQQTWSNPHQQQTWDDSQHQQQTWVDQQTQIVPTTNNIPIVPVVNNTQECTMDLYNTDQCIHTYNVVNTVEEVGIPFVWSHRFIHLKMYSFNKPT